MMHDNLENPSETKYATLFEQTSIPVIGMFHLVVLNGFKRLCAEIMQEFVSQRSNGQKITYNPPTRR